MTPPGGVLLEVIVLLVKKQHTAPEISQVTGHDVDCVRRWLNELCDEGLVRRDGRRGPGRKPATYTWDTSWLTNS